MRRIIGGLAALTALWLIYRSAAALNMYVSRGAPLAEAIADPAFLGPMIAAALALAGGLLAAFRRPYGAWLTGAAGLYFAAVGAITFTMGLSVVELASGVLFIVATGAMMRLPRN